MWFTLLVVAGVGFAWYAPESAEAFPLTTAEGEPLKIRADVLSIDVERGSARFTGKVLVRVGKLELRSETVELSYDDAARVKRVTARDGITARYDGAVMTSDGLTLDAVSQRAELHGSVEVRQGKSVLRARRATIELDTRRVRLERVSGSVSLQALQAAGGASAPAPSGAPSASKGTPSSAPSSAPSGSAR